jgi:chemotaxis protein CheD
MNFNLINIGIAEIGVSTAPDILRTILGSCVGICLYEPESKTGGISHIMLPTYKSSSTVKEKYADTAIPLLIEKFEEIGLEREKIVAKIIGGATMFKLSENSTMSQIGKNNSVKAVEILDELNIEITAQDIGGDFGRTIDFYLDTGMIKVKSLGKDERII